MVQWLGLHASTAGGTGSIPVQGSSTCLILWPKKKKKDYILRIGQGLGKPKEMVQ